MYKGFFREEKSAKIIICRLDEFIQVVRTKHDPKFFLLHWVKSSQSWLIPLVDDHCSTYLTKPEKQTHDIKWSSNW